MTEMAVSHGQGLSFDRAFALATRLDPETGTLTVRYRGELVLEAATTSAAGREAIEDFMAAIWAKRLKTVPVETQLWHIEVDPYRAEPTRSASFAYTYATHKLTRLKPA
ncbi:hypothetical protein [Paraburkholderia sp. BL17N1]|uniref:hypothetical protein n=1 Tax=Paraburkholderia sp. BL17N1 TaxID=1938798 RepID=UPI0011C3BBF3|nr:hypothetical protein [Paraburkholderia sp. BL17N1]